MSMLLAAGFAGAAAAVLVAVPAEGRLRFEQLTPAGAAGPAGRSLLRPGAGAALLSVPLILLAGPVAAALVLAAAVLAARWRREGRERRTTAAERAGAVEACSALAGELSAGRAPAEALAAAAAVAHGPAREALVAAAAAARLGGDVGTVLTAAAPGSSVAALLRALAACWTVCSSSGSGLASAVQRLEAGLRADQAQRRSVDAELAGPRATAGLLAVLPAVGLLMAAGLGADPMHILLRTPLGSVCLALGVALDALGLLWMNRLVARAGGTR